MGLRSPSPEFAEQTPILGTLFLIGKQGHRKNADLQSFPIDTDKITIGRDVDCDLRLYFPDVSKIHCEIVFDLLTNTATLLIHGSNPVQVHPVNSSSVTLSKGQTHTLRTNDSFTIRKKTFRFEYAPEGRMNMQAVIENTPVKHAAAAKRRGSYRLSLVPDGMRFVPLPSALGRGQTPKKATPAKVAHPADKEEGEEETGMITVVQGDNNDKIYLEPTVERAALQPFRTPEQPSKKIMRNTSAVPRTRKMEIAHTPVRGPNSLRKALLMRSARKVLAGSESRAIEPSQVIQPQEESNEEYEDEEEQEEEDADMSLDELPALDDEDVFVEQDISLHDEDVDDKEYCDEGEDAEEEEGAAAAYKYGFEEAGDDSHWEDEEVDPASIPLPETPMPVRYTPQQPRQPRKSLVDIAGPPVRFERLPTTPGAHPIVERVPATPGTMGKASRRLIPITPQRIETQDDWEDEADDVDDGGFEAERQRLRETLATPRALPLPPSTGFRSPVRDALASPSLFFASPVRHPALTRRAQEIFTSPPATPMDALKHRMAALRLQNSSRRATVGFALPSTPAAKPRTESALYTAGRMRKIGPEAPFAPLMTVESLPPTPTPDTVSLEQVSPQRIEFELEQDSCSDGLSGEESEEERYSEQESEADQEDIADEQLAAEYLTFVPDEETDQSPATPSYSGLRDLLREPVQPPPTPYFAGLRKMFASTPERPSTPQMSGLRELMKTPAPEPATPMFSGVRSMFALRTAPPTPAMDLDGIFDVSAEELGLAGAGIEAELEALRVEPEERVGVEEHTQEQEQDQGQEQQQQQQQQETPEPKQGVKEAIIVEAVPVPTTSRLPARTTRARRPVEETKSEPIKGRPRLPVSRVPRAAQRTKVAAPLAEVEAQPRVTSTRTTRSLAKPAVKRTKEAEEKESAPSRIPKKLPARAAKPTAAAEEPARTTRARARA